MKRSEILTDLALSLYVMDKDWTDEEKADFILTSLENLGMQPPLNDLDKSEWDDC